MIWQMKHKSLAFVLPLLALPLSACGFLFDIFSSSSHPYTSYSWSSTSYSPGLSGDGWEKPASVSPVTYRDVNYSLGMDILPSKGNLNLLVLPIQFKNYSFTSQQLTDLDKALNGDGYNDTGYWESLSSFYEKSSFGNVHMTFEIADVYSIDQTPRDWYNTYGYESQSHDSDNGSHAIDLAFAQYKNSHSTQRFDSDHNGFVDGVIAVYSCPDYVSGGYSWDDNDYFWAYCFWADNEQGSYASPNYQLYFWLSIDFIYEQVRSPKVDAHTLIHECGHMFGLDDYYCDGSYSKYKNFNPMGGWCMEDENILDHDAFSKMALGWTVPYVVTGNSATLTIHASYLSGECIMVPTGNWNGSFWDEYMLVELYAPEGLNYLDSHERYSGRELGYTIPGIKIYHVDARLMRLTVNSAGYIVDADYETDMAAVSRTLNTAYYTVGATNCQKDSSLCPADSDFSLIHLMEAGGRNTFMNGSLGTNRTLFQAGGSFSMSRFGQEFFPKKTTFNSGDRFDYTIHVDSIGTDDDGHSIATITVSK